MVARLNRLATQRAGLEVPYAQVRLLAQVEEQGPARISALAAADHCSQPTMTTQVQRLEAEGCPEVSVACTHGLFTGKAVERLSADPRIHEVVTTDTVPAPSGWPELRVRSVASLFAEAIHRSHVGESVSSLFDGVDPSYAPPQQRLPF